jgi:hypothetical protein
MPWQHDQKIATMAIIEQSIRSIIALMTRVVIICAPLLRVALAVIF